MPPRPDSLVKSSGEYVACGSPLLSTGSLQGLLGSGLPRDRGLGCSVVAGPGKWLIRSVDGRGQVDRAGFLGRPSVPCPSGCAAGRVPDPLRVPRRLRAGRLRPAVHHVGLDLKLLAAALSVSLAPRRDWLIRPGSQIAGRARTAAAAPIVAADVNGQRDFTVGGQLISLLADSSSPCPRTADLPALVSPGAPPRVRRWPRRAAARCLR